MSKEVTIELTDTERTILTKHAKFFGYTRAQYIGLFFEFDNVELDYKAKVPNGKPTSVLIANEVVAAYLSRTAIRNRTGKGRVAAIVFRHCCNVAEVDSYLNGNLTHLEEFLNKPWQPITDEIMDLIEANTPYEQVANIAKIPRRLLEALYVEFAPEIAIYELPTKKEKSSKKELPLDAQVNAILEAKNFTFYADKKIERIGMDCNIPFTISNMTPYEIIRMKIGIRYASAVLKVSIVEVPTKQAWEDFWNLHFVNNELFEKDKWQEWASEYDALWLRQLRMLSCLWYKVLEERKQLQLHGIWDKNSYNELANMFLQGPYLEGVGIFENCNFLEVGWEKHCNLQIGLSQWALEVSD